MRAALQSLRDDAARVPQLAHVERALAEALAEIDRLDAESRSKLRLTPHGSANALWHRGLR